jgi:hypothetical protein
VCLDKDLKRAAEDAGRLAAARDPYSTEGQAFLEEVNRLLGQSGRTLRADPKLHVYDGAGVHLDGRRDTMLLVSDRTLGVFAPAGEEIRSGGHGFAILDTDASVWVSSLEDKPIHQSKRLLVTHLTDCQNTEIRYAERARQTLLDWGKLPHLVRAGRAGVALAVESPDKFRVYALSTSGRRLTEVKTQVKDGGLLFTADVGICAGEHGAVFSYELVRE